MGVIDKITPLTPWVNTWGDPLNPGGGAKQGERLYYYVVKGKPPSPRGYG